MALSLSTNLLAADKIPADLSLTGARIIDVAGGRTLLGKTVLIRGDSILAVVDQKDLSRYAPKHTVNLRGKYVMPGLWDTHVHFGGGAELIEENKHLLPLYLAHGITAVHDCAGDLSDTVLNWRAKIASGEMSGPTIFTSGAKLEGYKPLWKGTIEVGTAEEVSAALDKLQGQQVDFVKITENTMTPAIYLESLKQVRARGMASSAHIPVQLTLDQVFAAGLSSIEHQSYLLRAATPEEAALTEAVAQGKITSKEAMKRSLASYDEATARAAFRRMAAAGTAIVPTLYGSYVTAYLDQNDHSHDDYLQYIGKGLRATYDWRVQRAAQDDAEAIKTRHALFENPLLYCRFWRKKVSALSPVPMPDFSIHLIIPASLCMMKLLYT
ncbi:amidohydrolase family protein [Undibacterium flavidum]|uniref:amidohydrolase family protein n=1 Tax=Undibacterium flavidum TaxID=2762297 RepID=UPI001E4FD9A6|nr:amidohydrolase [Undibacterium flavidum]